MCGISGLVQLTHPVKTEDLTAMIHALRHRGPDGHNHWLSEEGTLGLGHNRLAVIDTSSSGVQPMSWMDRYVITFNGEIYNYRELRENLRSRGYHFSSQTDTEVLLVMYHVYGAECLSLLEGMFAFALYDKEEKRLFCARDRFGEKPFYYHLEAFRLVFASEVKALWKAGIHRKVSEAAIYNYLAHNAVDDRFPFYEGVHSLKPGHYFCVELVQGQPLEIHQQVYFSLDDYRQSSWDPALLQHLVRQSVKQSLVSDIGLACTLSGGLDSAVIASIFAQSCDKPQSFGIIYPGQAFDESTKQSELVHALHVHHTQWVFDQDLSEENFVELVSHHDFPIIHTSVFAQNHLYHKISETGHRVILEGQGADEVFEGYRYQHRSYIRALSSSNKWFSAVQHAGYFLQNKMSDPSFYPSTLAQGIDKNFKEHWKYKVKPLDDTDDFSNGRLSGLLRYADMNSMMYGIELRLPFLQKDLVAYAFHLKKSIKFKSGYQKWPLRKAFEQNLPAKLLWNRQKIGFQTKVSIPESMVHKLHKSQADDYFQKGEKLVDNSLFKKHVLQVLLS